MNNIVTATVAQRPARKLVVLYSKTGTDYWSFCQEQGCDWEGLLLSIKGRLDIPALVSLPPAMMPTGGGIAAAAVEVPADYNGEVPEGYALVDLPAGDARTLGIAAPVRMSGDLTGAAGVVVCAGGAMLEAPGSAIIARNHIHMTPGDAARYGVRDRDEVAVRVSGKRSLVFENVPVRVSDAFALAMHIDFDEANACLCDRNAVGVLVRNAASGATKSEEDGERISSKARSSPAAGAKGPAAAAPRVEGNAGKKANRVISAEVARELVKAGAGAPLPRGCIITPLARDVLAAAGLKVRGGAGKDEPCLCAR